VSKKFKDTTKRINLQVLLTPNFLTNILAIQNPSKMSEKRVKT